MYRAGISLLTLLMLPFVANAATCATLSRGMNGPAVSSVQRVLYDAYEGFPRPTGYFGAITEAALKQWQGEHGIEPLGVVGPKTAAAMKVDLCGALQATSYAASPPKPTATVQTSTYGTETEQIAALKKLIKQLTAQLSALIAEKQGGTSVVTTSLRGGGGSGDGGSTGTIAASGSSSGNSGGASGGGNVVSGSSKSGSVSAGTQANATGGASGNSTANTSLQAQTQSTTSTPTQQSSSSSTTTAAVTAPALSPQAALKMFLMLGSDPNWSSLPDWYSGLINWGYRADPNVSAKPQEMKGEYVSVGSVPKYPYPNYPIQPSQLDAAEENTFLHATDPALLQMMKTVGASNPSFVLSWKADARAGVTQYKVYKIWFANNFSMPLSWTEWWKQYTAWFAITTIPSSSATSYSFVDPTSEADRNGWTVMCYMIKSIVNGVERQYSYPICAKLADVPETPGAYVASVSAKKLWENPIDKDYANVGYNFSVSMSGANASAQGYDAKLVLYKQSGSQSTANQQIGPLAEDGRAQLYFDSNGVSTNLTRQRPYLLNVSGSIKITEDLVFRIAVTSNGVETMYPRDGGYYTFNTNERIQDRLWYGILVNPASSGWKSLLSLHTNALLAKGYNTIFFDTWWPDFPEQFYSEAPSVEYNPHGAMTGEYAKALDQLADYLHANFPSMKFLGNALGQINDFGREFASLSKLDGGMFESCIISDGVKKTGSTLAIEMSRIDQVLATGKITLCWPKFQQIRWGRQIEISPFDPSTRLYALGMGLIMTGGQNGKLYYGPEELPAWNLLGQGINYFPEYRVDIGTPSSARQSLGTYVWQRQFTKGVVIVNADLSSSFSYTPPADMWKVKIIGEYLTLNADNTSVTGASYGTVGYDAVPRSVPISIPAASALILLAQ